MSSFVAERTGVPALSTGLFENMLPCYVLDRSYNLVDWNGSMHELMAKPFGWRIGMSATKVLDALENEDEIRERSLRVFGLGRVPLVDSEELVFAHPSLGEVRFVKYAAQLFGLDGKQAAWTVQYAPFACEAGLEKLTEIAIGRMESELLWSGHAIAAAGDGGWKSAAAGALANASDAASALLLGVEATVALREISQALPKAKLACVEFNETARRLGLDALSEKEERHSFKREESGRFDFAFERPAFDVCVAGSTFSRGRASSDVLRLIAAALNPGGRLILQPFDRGAKADAHLGNRLAPLDGASARKALEAAGLKLESEGQVLVARKPDGKP